MSTSLTDEENKRGTAHHEAGHAVVTLISRFFQLTDPAIKLAPVLDRTAQSGTRPCVPGLSPTREMGLEHAEIALAGRAGELLLEEITQGEGRRIQLHADSAADDFERAEATLAYWDAKGQRESLLYSAYECLKKHREAWEEIALLAVGRMGNQDALSKEEVEALPGVKRLLEKKRPL